MFSVGKAVVYPGYGVAIIARQIEKLVGIEKILLYELKFLHRDVTILVPTNGIENTGIRKVSEKSDLKLILDVFLSHIDFEHLSDVMASSWNRRSKEYQNRIRSGSLRELALIYKEIKSIEKQKVLSFGEKSVIGQVECLMAEECAFVEGLEIADVIADLRQLCEAILSGNAYGAKFLTNDLAKLTNDFIVIASQEKKHYSV